MVTYLHCSLHVIIRVVYNFGGGCQVKNYQIDVKWLWCKDNYFLYYCVMIENMSY